MPCVNKSVYIARMNGLPTVVESRKARHVFHSYCFESPLCIGFIWTAPPFRVNGRTVLTSLHLDFSTIFVSVTIYNDNVTHSGIYRGRDTLKPESFVVM